MRYVCILGMALVTFAGCNKDKMQPQVITASTESDGALHPAQLRISRSARVKCVFATGNGGSPAKCNLNGASTSPNESVMATEKVYLFCEGAAPSKCAARVEQ
jgi:hypothetical protein